ncbi:hypothetical protein LEP1GSC192_0640 [Leptospira sp. B5-022]|nr:hypothetical protein LEP1GSC192_0640 [Leptospira sp. B5-022]
MEKKNILKQIKKERNGLVILVRPVFSLRILQKKEGIYPILDENAMNKVEFSPSKRNYLFPKTSAFL